MGVTTFTFRKRTALNRWGGSGEQFLPPTPIDHSLSPLGKNGAKREFFPTYHI
jgi:hypothetical protein